nr:tetratricopeptide repeat protein [Clostridium cochlearium]
MAFKLDENYAEAYFQKALTLDAMRSYKEAIENYEEYIKLCPDDPAVYNNAGYTLYKMKKYDDALNYYNKALEIDPKYKIAISNRQDLLKKLK